MRWFKHYSDMYRGRSINDLFEKMGHTGPCCYFLLLELCTEKLDKNYDKNNGNLEFVFRFSERFVRQNLRISSGKLEVFLNICREHSLLNFKLVENILEIEMPILLDLLDSDFKRTRRRRDSDVTLEPLDKDKDKDKDIEEEVTKVTSSSSCSSVKTHDEQKPVKKRSIVNILSINDENELKLLLDDDLKLRLTKMYPDSNFLNRELLRAFNWYQNNPVKKPKTKRGWIRALCSWYERSWIKHIKQIKSNHNVGYSEQELKNILCEEL